MKRPPFNNTRHSEQIANIAIEVKASAALGPADFTGLKAIAGMTGVKRRILVQGGERAFNTADGVEALPAVAFAGELAAGRV